MAQENNENPACGAALSRECIKRGVFIEPAKRNCKKCYLCRCRAMQTNARCALGSGTNFISGKGRARIKRPIVVTPTTGVSSTPVSLGKWWPLGCTRRERRGLRVETLKNRRRAVCMCVRVCVCAGKICVNSSKFSVVSSHRNHTYIHREMEKVT